MLDEVGAVPGMFIIILYIAAAMDGFVIFSIMVRKIADVNEYASDVLKWQKIVLLYIAAAVVFVVRGVRRLLRPHNGHYIFIIQERKI